MTCIFNRKDSNRQVARGTWDGSSQVSATNLLAGLQGHVGLSEIGAHPGVMAPRDATNAAQLRTDLFLRQTAPTRLSHLLQLQQAQALGLLPLASTAPLPCVGTSASLFPSNVATSQSVPLQRDTLQVLQQRRLLSLLQGRNDLNLMQRLTQRQSTPDFFSLGRTQGLPALQTLPFSPSQSTVLTQTPVPRQDLLGIAPPDRFPPLLLARPGDEAKLSPHQVFLRHQIEAFRAGTEEASTHARGRNKPISVGQVGIRCRHCAYLPISRRQKGSTYFPASLQGIYQAAQNMCSTHMQCGLCSATPDEIKNEFARLLATKNSSSVAGRPYWADAAKRLGLIDTEAGIRFQGDVPPEQPGSRDVT